MPDLEISNLPALAEAGVAATDPLAIADISASETKKVTVKDLIEAGLTFIDNTSIPAAKIGTLGTDQVATGAIQDDAVTNAKLEHSTISLGGISLALGGTDATPAFNLTDATNYPTSSLSGTITNAQLAGSIANSKLANSSVSFGGISLNLGQNDDTPAFDLTDATGYKTTNLVGTITNAQLAGSIDVSKLTGSAISLGGVSVALGGNDATPAFNLTDATGYPTSSLVGTITNTQLAGSIANAKLANSSVSLGGVSIALGGTDDTPAFNLTDATGYPTSSLVGTITNAQLAGSIDVSKLAGTTAISLGGVSISLGGTDATPAFDLTDATNYPAASLTGTISNAQLAGSIANAKLVNSSVSLGGITVALGASDPTPAFDLTDATGYKTTNLVGTITNAQLAGSITAAKLAGGITNTQLAGSIANNKLANSSVNFGGVSVALGASDVTPAFNLTDATNYPASSLTGTITNAQLAGSIDVSKLTSSSASVGGVTITLGTTDATPAFDLQDATGYLTSALVGTITNAQLAGSIAATKLVPGSITSTQLGANSVTDSELANNAVDTGAVQNGAITNDKVETSTNSTTGLDGATKIRDASITPAKLNTSNLDRSLNVASGNLGINNAVSGGAATRSGITYNAEGLITGTVDLAASDLPKATTSAIGGVSVGTGLSVSGAGALSLTNSVTGATVSGITFNNQGMITAATGLVAGDLPVATTSAKGAVQITSGGGLTVDGSGNLTTATSGISAGTYQSITINNKGVATAGAALTEGLIPSLPASKITSGSLDAARIANDSIDGSKLSNSSTALFQSIAQAGYPTAQFSGQILFDTVSEDAYIWDGNAWQAITTLTKGSLVFGGTFNATTSKMVSTTTSGIAAGLAVGSNLPTPSATTDGVYVVVATSGTPSAPAPVVALAPPDYILGVTNTAGSSWNEIDLSQTVAGQVASNITVTPQNAIHSTNVQDALEELDSEKLSKVAAAGQGLNTLTGELVIGNTGTLVFEGSSTDAFQTTLGVVNPTTADKTVLLPNVDGTVITTGDTGTVTGTMLANGTIQNVDIKSDAAIAYSKLAALTSAQILVGNGSNVATGVAVTGDISINNAGLTAIASGVIVDGDISGSAAITGSKIATGTTSAVGVLQLTNASDSTSTTTAATPAAVKEAKDAADAAATTANAALPKAGGTLTDNLIIDNGKELRLSESDGDGTNYTGLKAQAQTGDITLTLPAVAPTANQVLKADASTPTTLTWAADSATDSTKMPLAGGTFTGDVTFTGDASDGLWDKSASAFVANLTGTASIATSITVADESSDTTCFPLFATAATGDLGAKSGSNLTFNSSSGALTATSFVGALTGNVTGNASGSAATVTGAAQSAITSLGTLTGLTVDGDVTLTGAANNVVWDKSDNALEFADSAKAIFGTGGDLEIYHSGSHSNIKDSGTGQLNFWSNTFQWYNAAGNKTSMKIVEDAQVELYYDNSKTLDTNSWGVKGYGYFAVDGSSGYAYTAPDNAKVSLGTGNDLQLWHDATDSTIKNSTGELQIRGDTLVLAATSAYEKYLTGTYNGAVELYHDNVKTFETYSSGVIVYGGESGNGDIYLYADEGDDDADKWNLKALTDGTFQIKNKSTGSWVTGLTLDGSNNATFAADVTFTGANANVLWDNSADALKFGDSVKARFGTGNDLSIYHDGSNSYIDDGGTGHLYIRNGTDNAVICETNGSVELFHNNSGKLETTATGVTVTGTVSDSKGNLRSIPKTSKNATYAIVAADAGTCLATNSQITVQGSQMSAGDAVTIVNGSGSSINIVRSSISLFNTGNGNDEDTSLGARGIATIYFLDASNAYISGSSLGS